MTTAILPSSAADSAAPPLPPLPLKTARPERILSIDALRGLVMFTMIYVNDIAGAGKKVPDWMVHFSDRHKEGVSGMTFVDLVFPAFLFLVGMSIPFALGSRLKKGEAWWKILGHVLIRAASLIMLGILMVNAESGPNREAMGWSPTRWRALMFAAAIFAFCSISIPARLRGRVSGAWENRIRWLTIGLRVIGFATLVFLAFAYRGKHDVRIISLSPFSIRTDWYGILGLIGWAYLAAAVLYLIFRNHRTALVACVAIMTAFFAAEQKDYFEHAFHGLTHLLDRFIPGDHFHWLLMNRWVDFGGTLGSQAAITVAGMMLATILLTPETATASSRVRFTLLFCLGFAFAATVATPLFGINKDEATPAWCLWSSCITAALWLIFYLVGDVAKMRWLLWPLAIAGSNVLLAYLISEGMGFWLNYIHLGEWYDRLAEPDLQHAIIRSASCGVVILTISSLLNSAGFRLKL